MAIPRRFKKWRNKTTHEEVREGRPVKELATGDLYIVRGFSHVNGDRIKVLNFDRRDTGIPEFRPCEEFNVEYA